MLSFCGFIVTEGMNENVCAYGGGGNEDQKNCQNLAFRISY